MVVVVVVMAGLWVKGTHRLQVPQALEPKERTQTLGEGKNELLLG